MGRSFSLLADRYPDEGGNPWSGNNKLNLVEKSGFCFLPETIQKNRSRPGREVYPTLLGGNPWSGNPQNKTLDKIVEYFLFLLTNIVRDYPFTG